MRTIAAVALCLLPAAVRAADVVADDPQAALAGDWEIFSSPSAYGGSAARAAPGSGGSAAVFRPSLPADGIYEISLHRPGGASGAASSLPVFVRSSGRTWHARVDQRAGAGEWSGVGEYLLGAGNGAEVVVTDMGDGIAVADAVRFAWKRPAPAPGRTFHVAPGGNDAGPGTAESPWGTLKKAAATLEAGDTVLVRAGTYAGGIAPLRTGSDHRFISFRAAPGETPVVSGSVGHGFDLSGKSWVRVEGFRVSGNAWDGIHLGASARDVEILDCELDGNGAGDPWRAGLMILQGCARVYARGCRAHDNTGFGFASDGETPSASFVTLERCESWKNGNDGFGFYARYPLLSECVSHENGWNISGNGDDFDFLHSRDVILDRCACWGSNAHFFKLGGGRHVIVNCVSADTQGEGYGRYPGIAFLGADSSGVAANCSVRGISMTGAGPYTIRNCVIRRNGSSSPISAAIYCANPSAPLSSDYNLFLPDVRYGASFDPLCHRGPDEGGTSYPSLAAWQAAGFDPHSSTCAGSPYADETVPSLDFTPRAGSPVIDAGTGEGAPLADFAGCGRRWSLPPSRSGGGSRPYIDIGAVEYRGGAGCPSPIALRPHGTSLARGMRFALGVSVQPVARAFDAYAVLAGPAGTFSILPGGRIDRGLRPYASNVQGLGGAVDAALLDIAIPPWISTGTWRVYAGLVPTGKRPSPANALALDSVGITVRE